MLLHLLLDGDFEALAIIFNDFVECRSHLLQLVVDLVHEIFALIREVMQHGSFSWDIFKSYYSSNLTFSVWISLMQLERTLSMISISALDPDELCQFTCSLQHSLQRGYQYMCIWKPLGMTLQGRTK